MSSNRIDRDAALQHLAMAEKLLFDAGDLPAMLVKLPDHIDGDEAASVAEQIGAYNAGADTPALIAGGGIEIDVSPSLLAAIGHALCAQVCLTEGLPRVESGYRPVDEGPSMDPSVPPPTVAGGGTDIR